MVYENSNDEVNISGNAIITILILFSIVWLSCYVLNNRSLLRRDNDANDDLQDDANAGMAIDGFKMEVMNQMGREHESSHSVRL